MKNRPYLFLESFRNIKKRFIAFLSIATIMTIGIGGLMAMFNLEVAMKKKGNDYFKEHNLKDFEMVASAGITKEDVEEILKIPHVADAEPVFRSEGTIAGENGSGAITILSETERIDIPMLREGAMPKGLKECALNERALEEYGLKIGDTVFLYAQEPDGILKEKQFVITGKIDQPNYIGKNEYLAILSNEAFDSDSTRGRYIALFIITDVDPKFSIFSKSYKKYVNSVREELVLYAEKASDVRSKELKEELDREYDEKKEEADTKFAEAEETLIDGEKQLKEKIEEAEKEIAENEQKIIDGRAELDKEIAKAEKQIADAEKELKEKLAAARKEIDDGRATAEKEFENAYNELCIAEGKYAAALATYNDGKKKYEDGKKQIEDANRQLLEKMDASSETINEYAAILTEALAGADDVLEEIENNHPELADNEKWNSFRSNIQMSELMVSVVMATDSQQRVDFLKGLIQSIDLAYKELPFPDEIKAGMEGLFDRIAQNHPKIAELKDSADKIKELIEAELSLPDAEKQIEEAKSQIADGRSKIDAGWSAYNAKKAEVDAQLEQAEKDYAAGKAEGEKKIADAKKELEQKKAESLAQLDDAEKQIGEAKEELAKTKAEKEKELQDGWDEFHKQKENAEEQLEDAKEIIEESADDNYLINGRNLTSSYTEYESSVNTIGKFELTFLPLFALVAGMVFFSTIAIIIDEQKKQVGAVKALGFYNKEILVKYIMFAGLGGLLGIILGMLLGLFLTNLVLHPVCDTYSFGDVQIMIGWTQFAVLSSVSLAVGIFVAYIACRKLLKCSAVGLINGSEPAGRMMKGRGRAGKGKAGKNGLYTKLIINNIRMDWERVMVSVLVMAGSCILIGFGYTTRFCFNFAKSRQLEEINNYTLQVVFNDDEADKMEEVKKIVSDASGSSIECVYEVGLIDMGEKNEGLLLIGGDPEKIKERFLIRNGFRKEIPIPEDGILLPEKCYGRLHAPDEISLYDSKLHPYTAKVSGHYENYIGFVAFASVKTYETVYGKEYEPNCLFIGCDTLSEEELEQKILSVSGDAKIYRPDYLLTKGDNVSKLFNLCTFIFVALAVILTFMILINLTNILVNRRMKEMLVMRINGFTQSQTIGYVARESIFTFIISMIVGTIAGIFFGVGLVPVMEADQMMFVRTPFPLAWIYALVYNVVFIVLIDFMAFRKIVKTPVTEITKY